MPLRNVTFKANPTERIFEFKKVSNIHVDTLPEVLKILRQDIFFLDNIIHKPLLIIWYKLYLKILENTN